MAKPGSCGGELLVVIDVQSKKQGAVKEIFVRDGDNAYRLAEDFVLR